MSAGLRNAGSALDIDLSSYARAEWVRLKPAVHVWKSARYKLTDRVYRTRSARVGNAVELAAHLRDRDVLITVAFEDAQLVRWQTGLIARYVPGARHVVVDNSTRDDPAGEIAAACMQAGVAYIRAPRNPWRGHPSRSHGAAMNWAHTNLVRPGRPRAFGFIDHDLFPTAPTDPFAPLARQEIYGLVRHIGVRWFLWAGFCFFRFEAVAALPLDFGQAWFLGLDTGGANWNLLYRRRDLASLEQAPTSLFPCKPGATEEGSLLQRCGEWLHEVGQTRTPQLAAEKRAALTVLLAPHLPQP